MGYYTDFKVTVTTSKGERLSSAYNDDALKILEEASNGYKFYNYGEDGVFHLSDAKWYKWEENMETLSANKSYKDWVFVVDGEGEESGDIWRAIFSNGEGRIQKAKIVFEDE